MNDLFVRAATAADEHVLVELEADARAALVGTRGGDRWLAEVAVVGPQWAERCATGEWLVLLAGLDDVVLGYLALRLPEENGVAEVEQVFVLEGAREIGLGDLLLQAALDRLRQRGATAVDGYALPGDRNTKNLFERNGLTARLITVSANLA